MRRRQGTLRKVQITPHAPRCRCLSHPITILAKETPNSFARIPDFREIRAILHQSTHPRRKTSHFFCKDSHPARYHVRNSPHFKQPPGRDAKKAAQNSASRHRTTQQSTPEDATQRKHPETLRRGTELRSRALPRTRRKEAVETPLPLYLSSYLETLE